MIPPPAPACLWQAAKPMRISVTITLSSGLPARGFATAAEDSETMNRREAKVVG